MQILASCHEAKAPGEAFPHSILPNSGLKAAALKTGHPRGVTFVTSGLHHRVKNEAAIQNQLQPEVGFPDAAIHAAPCDARRI